MQIHIDEVTVNFSNKISQGMEPLLILLVSFLDKEFKNILFVTLWEKKENKAGIINDDWYPYWCKDNRDLKHVGTEECVLSSSHTYSP